MTTTLDKGDQPYVTWTITPDPLNASAVSSAVRVAVLPPDGTQTDYTDSDASVVAVSDNVWRFEFPATLTANGTHTIKFFSTAGLVAAEEIKFSVAESAVT